MIAEIVYPFIGNVLNHKIEYQSKKIDKGLGRELYNSTGDTFKEMYRNMTLVSELNDRVKLPYVEFILSSPINENLSDEKFIEIAKEYLDRMGYGNSCYTIIKNDDKDHAHVHILATTIDLEGNKISDSNSKIRSGKIMRDLEKEYGLLVTEKGKSSEKKSLGESQYRDYFFDTSLHKSLRNNNTKEYINRLLSQSEIYQNISPDKSSYYTNNEWKIMLGEEIYGQILEALYKGKFFNPLFKDELLSVMDHLYLESNNVQEFRNKLEEQGYYMRLVSDKGKSHYVYGVPDQHFYIKDSSLPMKYRYGNISFNGEKMTADEQKHYLYNQTFKLLNESSSYDDFKEKLHDNNIEIIEHTNKSGIYGISYRMTNVMDPESFKASDISRRLTYQNMQSYFNNQETVIDPVIRSYISSSVGWEREIAYMSPVGALIYNLGLESGSGKRRKEEDELPNKKKKKKYTKGL